MILYQIWRVETPQIKHNEKGKGLPNWIFRGAPVFNKKRWGAVFRIRLWIGFQSGQWIRIRIQEGKITNKNREKVRNFIFEVLDAIC
jgi:hypothetical protein